MAGEGGGPGPIGRRPSSDVQQPRDLAEGASQTLTWSRNFDHNATPPPGDVTRSADPVALAGKAERGIFSRRIWRCDDA